MTARHLTSKNLFDCVFDDIPADATLDLGPLSLRETLALAAEPIGLDHNRPSHATDVFATDGSGDALDDNAEAHDEIKPSSSDASRLAPLTILTPTLLTAPLVYSAGNTATANATPTHTSFAPHLELTMNRDDAAVKEATKYAEFIIQERQGEAEEETGWSSYNRSDDAQQKSGYMHSSSEHDKGAVLSNMVFGEKDKVQRAAMNAEEQVRCMPPGNNDRYDGVCATYRHDKGYGFITPAIGGPDIYFVRDAIQYFFTKLVLKTYYKIHPPQKRLSPSLEHVHLPDNLLEIVTQCTQTDNRQESNNDSKLHYNGPQSTSSHNTPCSCLVNETKETDLQEVGELKEKTFTERQKTNDKHILDAQQPAKSECRNVSNTATTSRTLNHQQSTPYIWQPELTTEHCDTIMRATNLLTARTAQLLQWHIDLSRGCVVRQERLSFTVQRNRVTGTRGNSRLLRAEHICGPATVCYALAAEQAWFYPLFPSAVGRKDPVGASESAMAVQLAAIPDIPQSCTGRQSSLATAVTANVTTSAGDTRASTQDGPAGAPFLPRYEGAVRVYSSEEQRGYLCSAEADTADVLFYGDAVLWDSAVPPPRRALQEGMRVQYSVAGRDRHQKYIATLITASDGGPVQLSHLAATAAYGGLTEVDAAVPFHSGAHGGDGRSAGRGSQTRGGAKVEGERTNASRHVNRDLNMHRKRQRDDEEVLLFDEDDYALI